MDEQNFPYDFYINEQYALKKDSSKWKNTFFIILIGLPFLVVFIWLFIWQVLMLAKPSVPEPPNLVSRPIITFYPETGFRGSGISHLFNTNYIYSFYTCDGSTFTKNQDINNIKTVPFKPYSFKIDFKGAQHTGYNVCFHGNFNNPGDTACGFTSPKIPLKGPHTYQTTYDVSDIRNMGDTARYLLNNTPTYSMTFTAEGGPYDCHRYYL